MKQLIICDDAHIGDFIPLCGEFSLGLEVQAFYNPEFLNRDPMAIEKHLELSKGIDRVSMHGPFGDLCPGSFDPMIREVTRNRFDLAYDVAVKLGVKHVVLHHGYVPKTSCPKHWIERSAKFWLDFLDSKEHQFKYHIENHLELDHEIMSEVVEAVNRPNFDICLDIGHTNCCSKMPASEWIKNLKDKIGYVHLHNNYGEKDEHLGLEKGTIPIIEVCETLNKYTPEAIWTLETGFDDTRKSVVFLGDNGFI